MTIERYVLVDQDDREEDYEFDYFQDAKTEAARIGKAVAVRTYVYEDSELIWTPDGSDTWPPEREGDGRQLS